MKMFMNYDVNTPNSKEKNSEQQTAIGSSNVSETPDKPAEIQTESGGSRRTQGRTLLKDLYKLNPVERVKVSRNNLGQPIGSKARLLAGYLGIIARNANILPINYESWHQMPDSNKNQALDNIKKDISLEGNLRNVPPGMLRYQWEDVVGLQRKERTVSELEQAAGKNKNSRTQNSRLVKELDAFSFLTLHIGRKMDLQ
ncbi:UDP-N-acetylglucosamine--N-acetylmuramyl- (pentapeptide) pyrophosphoryl-undecaprenol N-acetylglucosamine transferase [Gossypium arboreum]|uniref:UDP-N-acetylglucosamine--N-acetylmuramyl-(Pentapeptide) pyrophosphoryl-undecaprenol N-acetylglucosamine transferase n=1 Tax=Gossypium arboreum TaxID=29729 RepID=A0A0B0MD94_GOSAR|nr:UDP-N-acetylglucosamine--N-acetylmuramyl- (pentapeptide) pyrophosphoryl-undecaprenol N-acetylglucosamine transferase [Gossypium arboreum]